MNCLYCHQITNYYDSNYDNFGHISYKTFYCTPCNAKFYQLIEDNNPYHISFTTLPYKVDLFLSESICQIYQENKLILTLNYIPNNLTPSNANQRIPIWVLFS